MTIPVYQKLGSEFMPPLDEGTLLYMPTTLPGISVAEASALLQIQDRILHSFPRSAVGLWQGGARESSTDPAPLSMMETTVVLKPQEQWPKTTAGTPSRRSRSGCSHPAPHLARPHPQHELIYGWAD